MERVHSPQSTVDDRRTKVLPFLILLILFILQFLIQTPAFAQVKVQIDSPRHLVGDKIIVKVTATATNASNIFFEKPDFAKARLELLDTIQSNWEKASGAITLKQEYHVAAYDSGKFYFPSIKFNVQKPGNTGTETLVSDSIPVMVNRMAVDTTQPPKPIRDIVQLPYTWQEYLPYIIGGIILLAIIIGLIIYLRRRKIAAGGGPKIPAKPPYEEAMDALEKLRKDKLWERGDVKEYYIALTDILRRYISRRWNMDAFEMTTAEIMRTLKREHIENAYRREIKEVLELSDLVKFAKHTTVPEENQRSLEYSTDFIQATRPAEPETPGAKTIINK